MRIDGEPGNEANFILHCIMYPTLHTCRCIYYACMQTVLGSGKSGAGSHDWVAGSCDPCVASQTSHCVVVVWKVRERSSR